MKRFASFAVLVAAAVLPAACTVVTNAPPPPQNPANPAPARAAANETVVKPEADGRPGNLNAKQNEAFWIWRGPDNDWHLRTTTAGNQHRFNGHIVGHGGDISGVKSASNEHGDKIKFEDGKVHFDFSTAGEADGIDFKLSGSTCVDFDLAIDGAPNAERIVVGAKEQHPTKARFTTCH